jgi:hypothetical protein
MYSLVRLLAAVDARTRPASCDSGRQCAAVRLRGISEDMNVVS